MGHPAVEDVGRADPVADRPGTGASLRDHPAADRPRRHEAFQPVRVEPREEAFRVLPVGADPGDVGEEDQLLRLERLGDRSGDGVGVDVVGLPALVRGDRGEHRDEPAADEALEEGPLDGHHVADEAERGVPDGRGDEAGVLPREPDRHRAVAVERPDDLAVHLPDEDHPGDVEGLRVGDPEAVDELGGLAEARHQLPDLGAAPVDHDRVDPDGGEQHHVLREPGERDLLGAVGPLAGSGAPGEGVPAVLHHHHPAGEAPDVGDGLDEHRGPRRRAERRRRAHEVLMFSSM